MQTVWPLSFSFSFQCQWSHIGGFLHPRTTAPYRIPSDAFWLVLAANLVYAAAPVLVALRVYSNPYFFLKIAPFPGQTGLPISEEKDTKYKLKWSFLIFSDLWRKLLIWWFMKNCFLWKTMFQNAKIQLILLNVCGFIGYFFAFSIFFSYCMHKQ